MVEIVLTTDKQCSPVVPNLGVRPPKGYRINVRGREIIYEGQKEEETRRRKFCDKVAFIFLDFNVVTYNYSYQINVVG